MRNPDDFSWGDRGPEELALDSWLEDTGPYVLLEASADLDSDEPDDEPSR